jgi:hypothetical protein
MENSQHTNPTLILHHLEIFMMFYKICKRVPVPKLIVIATYDDGVGILFYF